jgi:hypothetical protein
MMLERIEKLLRTRAPGEGNYAGHLPDLRLNSTPVRSAVRARGGIPTGWAAAVLAIGLVCIAGAAVFGPLRNGAQGNDSSPSVTQSITSSTPSAILGQPAVVASFGTDNLTAAVLGPDGAAYVLDDTNHTVYRVTLEPGPVAGERVPVYSLGQASADGAGTTGSPKLITTAGGDVLILDKANSLWRWHPASGSNDGRGTLLKVNIPDSATWGSDVPAIAARVIDFNLGTYEIWVAVPGQQQIFRYSPADDGSGYPTSGRFSYLRNAPNVAGVTDMFVTHDQSVFLADDGKISHYSYSTGEADSWAPPGGSALGYTPSYSRFVANVTSSGQVDLYAFDESRHTVVAFSASATTPVPSQWQMPSDSGLFQALTSMFVVGTGDAPTLYWTENGSLIKAAFPAVTNGPATPAPSTSGLPSTKPTVGGFTPTGPMTATRNRATATLLEDGRVLITGGDPPDVGSGPGTGSAEIYDPATGTFTATGRMTAAREGHTATRLSDGRVLIVGGCPYVAAEIYDPATGKFSATGSLSVPRYAPTAALLPDGRVLIVGGATAQPDNSFGEVYDPATGRFTETGALPRSFDASTLTVLRDGRVLLAGGWGDNVNGQLPLAELFDPATNQFTPT